MSDNLTVEVVLFKLKDGVKEADFVDASKGVEPFLQRSAGFIRRELCRNDDGQWLDIVHWHSLAEAYQAAEVILQEPSCRRFLGMIDESATTMLHVQQAQTLN